MALDILCIGAHPDDNEFSIGGTIALLTARGHRVRMLTVTNGCRGHYFPEYVADIGLLAERRRLESIEAARIARADYACLGINDGEVYVTPDSTEAMIRAIRSFGELGRGPDLILTNRPDDYHRDHRYTARLVLDAVYMLTVPPMCPDAPALRRMPVIAYWQDSFTEGGAFRPDAVVTIDAGMAEKVAMVCAHKSQFYEWIPYNSASHPSFADWPEDESRRYARMDGILREMSAATARRYRTLMQRDGLYAEAFQISEYGDTPGEERLRELFPSA